MTNEQVVLDETIHQSTRLRIMTLLVSVPEDDRFAFGFVQRELGLTAGNLTTHLRKLEDADYLAITKEFVDSKPRTWVQATRLGRRSFAEYLSNLHDVLNFQASIYLKGGRLGGTGSPCAAGEAAAMMPRCARHL